MGRQWLHAKREVASLKKSKATSKYVREITLAARQGSDPALNARLATALDRARKESVAKDVIQRAIEKGLAYRDWETDRKSTRLNSSHSAKSRMPSSA